VSVTFVYCDETTAAGLVVVFQKEKPKDTKSKYLDFLDILLTARDENGCGLTDIEIRNEVDTVLFAGKKKTIASVNSTLMLQLADQMFYQNILMYSSWTVKHRAVVELYWLPINSRFKLAGLTKKLLTTDQSPCLFAHVIMTFLQ